MPFLTDLKVESWRRSRWKLIEKLEYGSESGALFIVKPGFITDLASIPRPLRLIFEVNGKHRKAAVLHDWLYKSKELSRSKCDELFLEAMKSTGVSYWKRYMMYWGVRVGGWASYGN